MRSAQKGGEKIMSTKPVTSATVVVIACLAIGTFAATLQAQQPGLASPGKLRIGVAPSEAQLGQGNNAQGDYGTPIRNSIVLLMNGPAVEIVPLDAHLVVQVQAEAQQKQCDYMLFSSVT